MSKRFVMGIVIAVILASFLVGLFSVLSHRMAQAPHPTLASDQVSAPTLDVFAGASHKQTSILILGVDQLETPRPTLLAVWVVSFRLPMTAIYLLGVPVNWQSPALSGQTLGDRYAESGSAAVVNGLVEIMPVPFDATIVLDSHGFAALIDYVGGATLDDSTLEGSQATSVLSLLEQQPEALLSMQARLLDSLRPKVTQIALTPDLTPLTDLIPDHATSDLPTVNLVTMLTPLLPLHPERIHIQLLTSD